MELVSPQLECSGIRDLRGVNLIKIFKSVNYKCIEV